MGKHLHIILSLFVLSFCTTSSIAQKSNFFSFELAGSGGLASINFEHTIFERPVFDLNMRYGFSFIPIDKNSGTNLIFPVMAHGLIGKEAHKLDIAAGQALSLTTKGSLFFTMPLALGYRYQPIAKNYFLRLSYTPLVSYLVNFQWQNWAGATFGFHFNRSK